MPLPINAPADPHSQNGRHELWGQREAAMFAGWVPSTWLQAENGTESGQRTFAKGNVMYWSISLIVMASLGASDAQTMYGSYTKAYWTANAVHRPMLVIMNPAGESADSLGAVDIAKLQADERAKHALDDYVIAVIDTGTEHGKAVHKLFGSPALPRIVVIDERQDKQVFQSSHPLEPAAMAAVLEHYRTNAVVPTTNTTRFHPTTPGSFNSFQQGGTCPNCRKY